jgi:hypothetical protein
MSNEAALVPDIVIETRAEPACCVFAAAAPTTLRCLGAGAATTVPLERPGRQGAADEDPPQPAATVTVPQAATATTALTLALLT